MFADPSQAQTFDIFDAREDDMGFHADRTLQTVDLLADELLQLVLRGGDRMDVQAAAAAHAVDLRHRVALVQPVDHGVQRGGGGLDLEIAGDRAADLLRVDDGGVFLDDALLFQRVDAAFDRHARQPDPVADLGVGVAGVPGQQGEDFLVKVVQTVEIHAGAPSGVGMVSLYHKAAHNREYNIDDLKINCYDILAKGNILIAKRRCAQ